MRAWRNDEVDHSAVSSTAGAAAAAESAASSAFASSENIPFCAYTATMSATSAVNTPANDFQKKGMITFTNGMATKSRFSASFSLA